MEVEEMEEMFVREIVDFNNYVVKTYEKEKKIYYILEKTYYSKETKKYVSSGSIFIDKQFASALIKVLGIRLFDNAKVFCK